ncbi:helix-turn-helix domain-containing protein [Paracoccus litorisediminis]|uniref:Helix-turn-helix domain-containing protein n=2 Tax=Paracoccus litorisediminis TaxID=2006130 RepID=A0A844HW94_9RHOB|nr:helix-turn-helix domain-containing protein [Paracoccus litorisediminis]
MMPMIAAGCCRMARSGSVTQEQLADTLGITVVHAQRVIAALRQDGLIELRDRQITIPDIARLMEFSEFNPDYLHLPPES